ncbi:hypothetical protein AB0M47_21005 [Hamadaea sp. NPDC051192]|uniref:hypothetical protein n=1 Tax=Hamadaea sp. NPDC051192 TaxID=3154940 RepID=UPI00343CC9B1
MSGVSTEDRSVCLGPTCEKTVEQRQGGRRAWYCSRACQQAAYRQRRAPTEQHLRQLVVDQLDRVQLVDVDQLREQLDGVDAETLRRIHQHLNTIRRLLADLIEVHEP